MMNINAMVLINNDMRVPVSLSEGENLEEITVEDATEAYRTFKRNTPKINHFTIISVNGKINLDDSIVCPKCGKSEAKAEFIVEYIKDVPEYWSLFYNTGCYDGEHIDGEKYTEETMNKMLETLRGFPQWDEKFYTTLKKYAQL